jgi:hypothetical protein
MARSKPYTKKLGIIDLVLLLATGIVPWAIVICLREMYRRQ